MRPVRLVLAALVAAGALAACDTGGPDPADAPVVGTWQMTESGYRTLATAAADVSYLSPHHPAEGTLAVSGIETPPLRYVVRTERPGDACDAGCQPRIEIWSRPLRGRQLPDRAELVLEPAANADLDVWTDDRSRGYYSLGPAEYAVTPTTLTVSPTPLRYGGSTAGELAGTLELPVRSLAAGVEAEVAPFDPRPFAADGTDVLWTFAPDGTFEVAYHDSVLSESRATGGTWAMVGDRVEITTDENGPVSTTAYEVRIAGGTLELMAWSQGSATGRAAVEDDLRIPRGALTDTRSESRLTFQSTPPRSSTD